MMKKLVSGFSLLFCLTVIGQEVPKNIEAAFKKLYPAATDAEWSSYSNSYVSEFMLKDDYKTASFDKSGMWLQTVTPTDEENLPAAVKTFIKTKFGDSAFDSAEYIETTSLKYYDIMVLDEEGEPSSITLDATGKIVKVVKEITTDDSEEEEDDEE